MRMPATQKNLKNKSARKSRVSTQLKKTTSSPKRSRSASPSRSKTRTKRTVKIVKKQQRSRTASTVSKSSTAERKKSVSFGDNLESSEETNALKLEFGPGNGYSRITPH